MSDQKTAPATNGAKAKTALWKRIVGGLVSLVIVIWIFVAFVPKFANYSQAWDEITDLSTTDILALIFVTALSLAAFAWISMAALPKLRFWQAFGQVQASSAVANALPAGGAVAGGLTWTMYRSWGHGTDEFARATILAGIWNTFVKLGMPLIAVLLYTVTVGLKGSFVLAALVGVAVLGFAIVLFALVVTRPGLAHRLGEWAGRVASRIVKLFKKAPVSGWGKKMDDFREQSEEMIRKRWVLLTATTTFGQFSVFFVLLVSIRVVGVKSSTLSFAVILEAFTMVRLATTIPITPGGVGITQAGLVGLLTINADPTTSAKVAAAVLIYTGATYLITFPLGAISYVAWRVSRQIETHEATERGSLEAAPAPN